MHPHLVSTMWKKVAHSYAAKYEVALKDTGRYIYIYMWSIPHKFIF